MIKWLVIILVPFVSMAQQSQTSWIRINQLGYSTKGIKIAVWCGKTDPDSLRLAIGDLRAGWELRDAATDKAVISGSLGHDFGWYGPFKETYRIDFSTFNKPGRYYLAARGIRSPVFTIGDDVYKGAADFCLRYMRQQRSGFNPFLKDSCHTHDGYVLSGQKAGIRDSTHVDVTGGWHDASDYLQYAATSANATYHLLMACRDFRNVFTDEKLASGLDGKNNIPDVLDEAKWGLNWLLKMHPSKDVMFNQVGDDRDHMGMRTPKEDSFYGKGFERPVYFLSGEPQQRGKFMNNTNGTASTAGKFSSAFALAASLRLRGMKDEWINYEQKAFDAYYYGLKKPGKTQTASVRSPYIYAEDNWTDDMELAAVTCATAIKSQIGTIAEYKRALVNASPYIEQSYRYAQQESCTPWLGSDTANHYQWYPFINLGHYELAKQLSDKRRDTIIGYYKEGIKRVWNKAEQNAFYRGVPFIWCSNNLTVSFAIQCYLYRRLTNDTSFARLEQANFDWLFGCNPWGTSMVYGLPSWGDTPTDPHSAFTHLKNYPIDGGLVDGPVYTSIYKNLIGIRLYQPDEYADLQSDLAVYHDDYGDYSTNEPTMDGTASLIYLLAAKEDEANRNKRIAPKPSPLIIPRPDRRERSYEDSPYHKFCYSYGAIIRGDSTKKKIALVFTVDQFVEGGEFVANTLQQHKIKASFFFTTRLVGNASIRKVIQRLVEDRHLLGPHSHSHLLYCDWQKRDSLLITREDFMNDLLFNLDNLHSMGVNTLATKYFLPPYEWYNATIASWTNIMGLQLINYTPGTLSNADYTTIKDKNYRSSETIYNSIINYEKSHPAGLNGFILLMHLGAGPDRTDKFYKRLPELLKYLEAKGYQFQTVDQLLKAN
jgi:peptidoglycan/xylan/chitin deacetylase (PgdA/CDA1 family)